MTSRAESIVKIDADMTGFNAAMDAARQSTRDFGRVFTSTVKSAAISGRSFEDTLRSIAMRLSTLALNSAFKPIENSISGLLNNLMSGILPNARGGAFGLSGPIPFARGGIVNSPSLFSFAGGTGLMGEAGAEAILPLSRGPDGKLGVAGGQAASPVNIVFNVQTADVAGFKQSEGQLTAMLARTVQRGQRKL